MSDIKDYKLLSQTDINMFHNDVREHIKNGWQPTGGIAIAVNLTQVGYFQAMVRNHKPGAGRPKKVVKDGI